MIHYHFIFLKSLSVCSYVVLVGSYVVVMSKKASKNFDIVSTQW